MQSSKVALWRAPCPGCGEHFVPRRGAPEPVDDELQLAAVADEVGAASRAPSLPQLRRQHQLGAAYACGRGEFLEQLAQPRQFLFAGVHCRRFHERCTFAKFEIEVLPGLELLGDIVAPALEAAGHARSCAPAPGPIGLEARHPRSLSWNANGVSRQSSS
jgi:hypothetical protein